jgi:hypothetical protein
MEEFLAGWKAFILLFGTGGITTVIVAWLGWRKSKQEHESPNAQFSAMFADRLAIDHLSVNLEKLSDSINKAIEKYDFHQMVETLRRERDKT